VSLTILLQPFFGLPTPTDYEHPTQADDIDADKRCSGRVVSLQDQGSAKSKHGC